MVAWNFHPFHLEMDGSKNVHSQPGVHYEFCAIRALSLETPESNNNKYYY